MTRKTFSRETRERIWTRDRHKCSNARWGEKCLVDKGLSIHHVIHNTKMNDKIYGSEHIQSEENGVLLCDQCHTHHSEIPWITAKRKYLESIW